MKPGRGKQKGNAFERKICVELSLWVSGGKEEDLFWRSAMSGGRATAAATKGKKLRRQAGDISAVSSEGHELTDQFFIECKFYRSLDIEAFIFSQKGNLWNFWEEACLKAKVYHKEPILIAKQNRTPTLLLTREERLMLDGCYPDPLLTCHDTEFFLFDTIMAMPYQSAKVVKTL